MEIYSTLLDEIFSFNDKTFTSFSFSNHKISELLEKNMALLYVNLIFICVNLSNRWNLQMENNNNKKIALSIV